MGEGRGWYGYICVVYRVAGSLARLHKYTKGHVRLSEATVSARDSRIRTDIFSCVSRQKSSVNRLPPRSQRR